MIELNFIKEGIQKEEINRFITEELGAGQISQCIVKKTPLHTHILLYTQRPARIVGFKGTKLIQLKDKLTDTFGIKNLKLDVYSIDNPYLDASLMANFIARSLEQGKKHKRVVSFILNKIMSSGAIGVEINICGKISGSRSRGDKFYSGYLKKCGDSATTCVEKKKVVAVLKQGTIGIKVIIMKVMPDVMQLEKNINALDKQLRKEMESKKKADAQEQPEKAEAEPKPVVKEEKAEVKKQDELVQKEEEEKKEVVKKPIKTRKEESAKKDKEKEGKKSAEADEQIKENVKK